MTNKEFLQYLQYDSCQGKFLVTSTYSDENSVLINDNLIFRFNKRSPEMINWDKANVEYIIDCTGVFKTQEKAKLHLYSEKIRKIIISSPSNDIPMYVMGVNHFAYNGEMIVSNASCTTNCLAPLVKVIHDNFTIENALMSTIHSITSSQNTLDNRSKKNMRVGRCCLNNIIPTTTGAAKCVGKVIPELEGKSTGMSFRVPTPNVSVVDLTVKTEKSTSYEEICAKMKEAASGSLSGILEYTEDEVVSSDFIHCPASSIFDAGSGMGLSDTFFKLVSWYDNEWGYSNRCVDLLKNVSKFI